MIREAKAGELLEWPTAENGEAKFVIDQDGIKGFACVSRVPTPNGDQCWVHDAYHWGEEPNDFLVLALRIRKQVHDWGFKQIYTNVNVDSPMFPFWLKLGLKVEQYILTGTI